MDQVFQFLDKFFTDATFREHAKAQPELALAGYSLDAEQQATLLEYVRNPEVFRVSQANKVKYGFWF